MNQSLTFRDFAWKAYNEQPNIRVDLGAGRHHSPEVFHAAVDSIVSTAPHDLIRISAVGKSFEGRPLRLMTAGTGPIPVLLWSQMHGDEPTATAAIADILKYFTLHHNEPEVHSILSSLTLSFLPLLNPDGAVRRTRRTAQQIDMNRDALALRTPEAALLKQIQHTLKPTFGFNLHDQELSTAGNARALTAMGLLAPAYDHDQAYNDVRWKARHLAATFAGAMMLFTEGRIARYDDSFEPRAFGDNMQKWGTSTLLVESGHAVDDPEKELIRRLNVAGILSSLLAIATGEYRAHGTSAYDSLPFNTKKAYDLIYRNVTVVAEGGKEYGVDLGLSSQVDTHSEPPAKLVDVGDLHAFAGWKEVDAAGKHVKRSALLLGEPFELPQR